MKRNFYVLLLLLFVLGFFVGCAGSPARLSMMDQEELSKVSDKDLLDAICHRWTGNELIFKEAKERKLFSKLSDQQLINTMINDSINNESMRKRVREEVKERGIFTSNELALIMEEKIAIGMSEKALKASWGEPSDINKSVGSYGVHKQYVYGHSNRTYVYVKNGKVSGWQN